MSLLSELKRRNVFRVAVAYAVTAWLLAQIGDLAFQTFGTPDWVGKTVLFVLILGFPLAVFFAWAFELTPEGIKKEKDVDRRASITAETGRRLNVLIIAVLAIAVALLLLERSGSQGDVSETEQAASDASRLSIAVLPFDNRSNRPEDEYFTEGIHDDLLTTMANIGSLKVISRTSVMEYKDTTKKIPEIAKELGVANILEGGIQRAGNQVRINVQLIDAETDEHLWANIYDRELTAENLFAIQSEVSEAIAGALHATLSPEDSQRINSVPTESLEAYESYLLGRQRWSTRTTESTAEAVELFLRAIELDPEYAEAWAGLGDAYRHQVAYGGLPRSVQFPKAEKAINRALAIDKDLAEGHAALGGLMSQLGRGPEAVYHLERAIELNPSYSPAYNWLALTANALGQVEEANELLAKGLEIDPLSAVLRANLGQNLIDRGQDAKGVEVFKRLTETHPDSVFGYRGLADAQARHGRFDHAMPWALQEVLKDPEDVSSRVRVAYLLINLGDNASAAQWIESARELQRGNADVLQLEISLQLRMGFAESETAIALASKFSELSANDAAGFASPITAEVIVRKDLATLGADAALDKFLETTDFLNDEYAFNFWHTHYAHIVVNLLRQANREEEATAVLTQTTEFLEDTHLLGRAGSGRRLPAAYALAGRNDEALDSLRKLVDAGWRRGWWFVFDHHWSFESLRDNPEFQSLRMEIAADMAKQLENIRHMQRSGELPTVPGMDPIRETEQTGVPPI
jgi:TolB-like protein/Tfp pilus assembly protein PilF